MYINEAVKRAIEKDSCITTREAEGKVKIKPTDEIGNCIVMNADGSNPSKYGWQPSAKDLIRNDWVITS